MIKPLHRVIAAAAERVTAQQPRQSLQSTTQDAITFHRFRRVFRTSGNIAACRWQQRRNRPLVASQHLQHDEFGELVHVASGSGLQASGTSFPGLDARLARKLLFYYYESSAYFVHDLGEVNDQQRLLRIDDHIRSRRRHTAKSHGLAQAPLHPVALHRATERAAHGISNTRAGSRASCRLRFRPQQIKRGQRRGKMPPPQLVYPLEVGVPQETSIAGKTSLAGSRLDPSIRFSSVRFSGHTGSHSDSEFHIAYIAAGARSPRHWTIRGNLVSPRPACAPWRDGGKLPSCRPGSSCACEIRELSIACAGWVGMYAWA